MKLRCLACNALNGPDEPVCASLRCGADLRHAEKVYPETVEAPAADSPDQADRAQAPVPGFGTAASPEYCACDPTKRPSGAATACWICDRPYRLASTLGPAESQPAFISAKHLARAVAVLAGGLSIPVQDGLLLGREIPGTDPALAIAMSGKPGISRVHAWIRCAQNQITVLDLGSRNGTWIAGQRLRAGCPWQCTAAELPVVVYLGGMFSMTIQREPQS